MAAKKATPTATKKKATKKEKNEKNALKATPAAIQPEVNIGLVGHVDHGKTTLTERLSGKWTDTHSEEIKRGITIRLGYADMTIYKCGSCKPPACYSTSKKCIGCMKDGDAVRKISLVDAPGHESLMATMLAGTTIIDGALLLVAANESCPQPQTREHLMAMQILGIKNVIIVQNKIDLVKKEQALKNYQEIRAFMRGSKFEDTPVIPISAQHNINVDFLLSAIEEFIPTPERDKDADPLMFVARSFDINKPGSTPDKIVGGVLGGAVTEGRFSVGDRIEIRPGRKYEKENKISYEPLTTTIAALKTGGADVESVLPGGSIGVLTKLDPGIVKSDALVGSVVGRVGKLPPTWDEFTLDVQLLKRVLGTKERAEVEAIKKGETLMLNVNSAATVGVVTDISKNMVRCKLKLAVCAKLGARVTISRRMANRFRLIGYGIIKQ